MAKRERIEVVVPAEPPVLTPRAARALLQLLLEAKERSERDETAPEDD